MLERRLLVAARAVVAGAVSVAATAAWASAPAAAQESSPDAFSDDDFAYYEAPDQRPGPARRAGGHPVLAGPHLSRRARDAVHRRRVARASCHRLGAGRSIAGPLRGRGPRGLAGLPHRTAGRSRRHRRVRHRPAALLPRRACHQGPDGRSPGSGIRPPGGWLSGVRRHRRPLLQSQHRRSGRRGCHCWLRGQPSALLPRPTHDAGTDGDLHRSGASAWWSNRRFAAMSKSWSRSLG